MANLNKNMNSVQIERYLSIPQLPLYLYIIHFVFISFMSSLLSWTSPPLSITNLLYIQLYQLRWIWNMEYIFYNDSLHTCIMTCHARNTPPPPDGTLSHWLGVCWTSQSVVSVKWWCDKGRCGQTNIYQFMQFSGWYLFYFYVFLSCRKVIHIS